MNYNKYRTVKLDKRHKGVGQFAYYVDFYRGHNSISITDNIQDFLTRRVWAWDSFGPAQEIDFTFGSGAKWAWWRDGSAMRLYFTETTFSAYVLQWH